MPHVVARLASRGSVRRFHRDRPVADCHRREAASARCTLGGFAEFEVSAAISVGSDDFVWDPTEPIATRPLMYDPSTAPPFLYCHDGNKNVSETVTPDGTIAAHYEYSSFGKVVLVASENESQTTATLNPYRFSSEYADDAVALVYYNYRHYNPLDGRWIGRDLIDEWGWLNLYVSKNISAISLYDKLGLTPWGEYIGSEIAILDAAKAAVDSEQKCVNSVSKAFERRNAGYGDKLNHCLSSCEIANGCGKQIADALGFIKEVRDLFFGDVERVLSWILTKEQQDDVHDIIQGGSFQDSVDDFAANLEGLECAKQSGGCECCCKKLYSD